MSGMCQQCGGLIAEPNLAYGYGGKFCHCAVPVRTAYQDYYSQQTSDRQLLLEIKDLLLTQVIPSLQVNQGWDEG
jgi:hypothetical protein